MPPLPAHNIRASLILFDCAAVLILSSILQLFPKRFSTSLGPNSRQKRFYNCKHCDNKFASKQELNRHRTTLMENPHICSYCGWAFRLSSNLRVHEMTQHRKAQPFRCLNCSVTFATKSRFLRHAILHGTSTNSSQCGVCGAKFRSIDSLRRHYEEYGREEHIYKCKICSATFPKRKSLHNHNAMHRSLHKRSSNKGHDTLGTLKGNLTQTNKDDSISPNLSREKLQPTVCPYCNVTFPSQRTRNVHCDSVHGTSAATRCSVCAKSFATVKLKLSHMQTDHQDTRKIICDMCSLSFITKNNLKRHSVVHEDTSPLFECKICRANFSDNWSLGFHQLHIHPSSPNTVVSYQSTSTRRMDGNNKSLSLPFQDIAQIHCVKCNRSFKARNAMLRHWLIHREVLPYKCEFCYRSFRQQTQRQKHVLMHLKPKFHCRRCKQAFRLKREWRSHILEVHGVQCQFCNVSCLSPVIMAKHIKTKHGRKLDPTLEPSMKRNITRIIQKKNNASSTHMEKSLSKLLPRSESNQTRDVNSARRHRPVEYGCRTCGRILTTFAGLQIHERTHTGSKPYECFTCDRRFADVSNLRRHQQIHAF